MNAIAFGALLAVAALAPFSTAPAGGPLPPGWRIVPVPHATPAEISLEADDVRLLEECYKPHVPQEYR